MYTRYPFRNERFDNMIETWRIWFLFLLSNTTGKKEDNLFTLVIKMLILFAWIYSFMCYTVVVCFYCKPISTRFFLWAIFLSLILTSCCHLFFDIQCLWPSWLWAPSGESRDQGTIPIHYKVRCFLFSMPLVTLLLYMNGFQII